MKTCEVKFNTNLELELDSVILDKINKIFDQYLNNIINKDLLTTTEDMLSSVRVIAELYEFLDEKDVWDNHIYNLMDNIRDKMLKGEYINRLSLFNGLAEIGLVVYILNRNTGNYSKFLNTINNLIVANVPRLLEYLNKNIDNLTMFDYDCVTGVSGVVAYLSNFYEDKNILNTVEDLLIYLVNITEYTKVNNETVPGWYIKQENQFRDDEKETFQNGNFNFGLSHGIAGPLVAFSLCYKKGIKVNGQREAIDLIIKSFKNIVRLNKNGVPFWPGQFALEDYLNNNTSTIDIKSRMSWCYGSIGILRALKLAANAIDDSDLKRWVSEKIILISKMNIESYDLESPTLCHGYSGLMLMLILEYKEYKDITVLKRIKELLVKVLDLYTDNSKFGFINIDRIKKDKNKIVVERTDDNCFLTGSSGVILSLISIFKEETYFEKQLLLN